MKKILSFISDTGILSNLIGLIGIICTLIVSFYRYDIKYIISGIFILIIIILFIYNLKKFKELKITEDFNEYGEQCIEIVKNAEDYIYSIQTPQKLNKMKEGLFKKYVNITAEKIFEVDCNLDSKIIYRRLVVINKYTVNDEIEKIESFLKQLFYCANNSKSITKKNDLSNFELCIVPLFLVSKYFYSNFELLITKRWNYSIAFQEYDIKNTETNKYNWLCGVIFSPRIIVPVLNIDKATLKNAYETIWSNGIIIEFKDEYKSQKKDINKEQERIINSIKEKMNRVSNIDSKYEDLEDSLRQFNKNSKTNNVSSIIN